MDQFNQLPRSVPSTEGLDARAVVRFLDEAQACGLELHSLMIVKNGKVLTENWWEPYEPITRQACYSVTKTFTATAIGFAVEEGILSLSDRLAEIFPDKLPKKPSEGLLVMTVHDLLCMGGGQDVEANVHDTADWVKSFMAVEVKHNPGMVFKYNSIGSHMLAEIMYRLTGKTLLEYLTPRLFEPIGISDLRWDKTPAGIDIGGWGIHLTTEALARMGLLFLQRGKWYGRQAMPEAWIEKASAKQINNADTSECNDWKLGYCYQMWRSTPANSYRLDGAFGQFSIVLPDQNAVIALTESTEKAQLALDLLWKHVVPGMCSELAGDVQADSELSQCLTGLSVPDDRRINRSPLEKKVSGKTFELENNQESLSTEFELALSSTSRCGIEAVKVVFVGDVCGFSFICGGHESVVRIGLDGQYRTSVTHLGSCMQPIKAMGCWADENMFQFVLRPVEAPQSYRVMLHFAGESLEMSWVDVTSESKAVHQARGCMVSKPGTQV
jgi:CubicO group peptidase (beta-lactamase class C family)